MSEAALSRISNLIKVEDDLLKLDSLRLQFAKEGNLIDIKLTSASRQQIDSVVLNLEKLKTALSKVSAIKTNIEHINTVYTECVAQVKEYDSIRDVSVLHQKMMQVQSLYTDIANFQQYLTHVDTMIDAELQEVSENIEYPMHNLYRIHFNVTQARNLGDYLETESSVLSDDIQSIVAKIVAPLRKVVRHFDALLKEVIISITEAVKEGNTEMVGKLVRIIELESAEDLKVALAAQLNLVDRQNAQLANYGKTRTRQRNYRSFFFEKLQESLEETFDKCVDHFRSDKLAVFDNLDWLEDELEFVGATLAPLFPKHWNITTFISGVYYDKLHAFALRLISNNPPAEDLMRILEYDSHYGQFVARLPIETPAKSILGDDLKTSVLDDYMKVILMKMTEWNTNLMRQEAQDFTSRSEPPDVYLYTQNIEDWDQHDQVVNLVISADVYVLPDFRTTLSMLKEQADVASDSGYGKVLVGVIESWSVAYNARVEAYARLVEDEVNKYMSVYNNERFLIKESKTRRFLRLQATKASDLDIENMTAEEKAAISPPGLVEYLTALGNTYEINTDRLQDKFLPNYMTKVHLTYQTRIEDAFQATLSPSTDLNAQVIRSIADIVINDLLPALSTVFTLAWYDARVESSMAQQVVDTVVEYMEELKGYASYDLYSLTFTVVLDMFISSYLRIGYQNIIHGSGKKIDPRKADKFCAAVNRDVQVLYEGLDPLFSRKDAHYLMGSLTALELLTTMATIDNMDEMPAFWEEEVLQCFYHCSVDYVRGMMLCRKDVSSKEADSLVEKLTVVQNAYQDRVEPPESAVATLSGFSYT